MLKLLPKWIVAILASAIALYVVLSPADVALYDLILFPCPDPRISDISAKVQQQLSANHITWKEVSFRSSDGRLLYGLFFEVPNTKRVFLYSHAKGNNIYGKIHVALNLLLCGGSVLMYDYQGYGRSEGKVSVGRACDDAMAAYDYLIEKEHRTGKDIIAFGESFGTGVTGQLVTRRKLGGVILQSGFSSLIHAGRETLFWLHFYPDSAFPKEMVMNNIAVFSKPHPPLLIMHGEKDKTLSVENAQSLYDQAVEPKTLVIFPDGGHGVYGKSNEFWVAIRRFLQNNNL